MCKKMFFLVSIVLVLGVVNSSSAATITWDNNAPDNNSWCDRLNWDPNTSVPGPDDTAVIRQPHRGPIVDCDVDVAMIDGPSNNQVMDVISGTLSTTGDWDLEDGSSTINITGSSVVNIGGSWPQKNGTVILNISGNPTITVDGSTKFGNDGGDWVELHMSGGSLTVVNKLEWGDDGGGELNVSGGAAIECGEFIFSGRGGDPWTLNLNGGTMTVVGKFTAPDDSEGSGNVFINLDAGTLECGSFDHGDANYAMDINEGMFIIDGNEVADISADVNANYITAFNGTVDVSVTYDEVSGKTIVTADYVRVKAWDPSPDNYATNMCPGVKLSWEAGAYAVDHNVYFGPSLSDVNESADPCLDHHSSTNWTPPGLELGTKYYWRVDGVDDTDVNSPWVGDIWEFTTNDGNAFDPYPEDKETAVPVDTNLHWTRGCTEDSHDVYFGTDYNDVRDATSVSHPNVVYVNRDVNNFDPCDFDYFTWYYWRIDEVDDGTTYKGKVWSFRSISDIEDPNLILWYKFDEDWGPVASDSSGYEHHGNGYRIDEQWEPNNGHINGCLDFDADEHVAVPSDTLETINKEITVSVWVKGDDDHADEEGKVFDTGGGDYYARVRIPTDDGYLLWRAGNDTNDSLLWRQASPLAWAEDWHHFVFIKNENEGKMYIYFDGEQKHWKTGTINSLTYVKDTAFRIGADNDQMSDYTGKLDDFRVYDWALPEIEIERLFRGEDIEYAWAPNPYHGEADAPRDANLVWKPGAFVADMNGHQVYFGTDYEAVRDANTTVTLGVYKGDQNETTYDLPILDLETTYYWRIDEVNGPCTWPGPVWRFTVASFLVVDDFESYDKTTNQIKDTWHDYWYQAMNPPYIATGGVLDLGIYPYDVVHSGDKAMLYQYRNILWTPSGPGYASVCYSEASLPIPTGQQDWTRADVRVLSLYFYGGAGNDANDSERMFVGVEDGDGNYAEVRYGVYDSEEEDMNDLKIEEWQVWNIGLPHFNDTNYASVVNDVNLSNIAELYIGFGDKQNPVCGGEGVVLFDDIRLSLPICKPKYGPVADFSGNCIVDMVDVGVMGEHWLLTDANFGSAIEKPDDANLLGWWKLDDGDGNTAADSSSYNHTGTIEGDYSWVAGHNDVNTAVEFDDGRVLVADTNELRPKYQVSVTAWVYYSKEQDDSARVVAKGADNKETFALKIDDDDDLDFHVRDANGKNYDVDGDVWRDDWIHLAGTCDGDTNTVKCYINGVLEDSRNDANFAEKGLTLSQDANGLAIGNRSDDMNREFEGTIDEVRVYDYALSAAEVAWLASDGTGYVALTLPFNLYDKEALGEQVINFKDFAMLLDDWMEKALWP